MKLSNIFKKETKSSSKVEVQKLNRNQLEKVIGGGDDIITDETNRTVHTTVMGPAKGK